MGYEDGLVLLVRIPDGAEIVVKSPDGSPISAMRWNETGTQLGLLLKAATTGSFSVR